ncbi:MAG: DUF4124 domain-containing protein [Gammaproteobacteria bacterium]|nr:DUF4124 domain-containing protein [Gammaproteobacteria bacterium]
MPYLLRTIFLILFFLSQPVYAELKKWVDTNGQIHYGDKVPPQYLRKEHKIMNQEGVVIENVPASKTEEQLRAERRQQKINEIQAEKKRQQDFKDRVLIDTYTTERDLLKAREERIGTFTSLIDLTYTIIKSNEEQLQRLLSRKAEFERFEKPLPAHMQEQEKILRRQIIDNQGYIDDQKKERDKIMLQFDKDLSRFLYLKEQEHLRNLELERRRLERKRLEEEIYNLPAN